MRTCAAWMLLLFGPGCFAQAYPEPEAAAAWRALAAGYVRQAVRDRAVDMDPALNARVDAVMRGVAAACRLIIADPLRARPTEAGVASRASSGCG